jgi:signal transduction histidine kinase
MRRHTLLYLTGGMAAALFVAIMLVVIGLQPPTHDLNLLILFMLATGVITIGFVYVLYQRLLVRWMHSLRWSLLMIVITAVLLVFVNVWATAQLMFISSHDLILTTALLVYGGLNALVFGIFIANTLATKIAAIASGIEKLAQGQLDARVSVDGDDELSQLGGLLNWMAQRLQAIDGEKQNVEQTRRDLITWISHDLRTPLTAIQAILEAIADEIVTGRAEVLSHVNQSLVEVENLKDLIDDLFALAQLNTGHIELECVEASLCDLISDIVSSTSARAASSQVTITGEINAHIDPVYMAPDKIQRVLVNLIDNALHHTPQGGQVTIRAFEENQAVRVDVHNTGSAIDPQHLPYIFNQFYRAESSRTRSQDGHRSTGLGLAIAHGFIEAHQGKIWAESLPEQGTQFSFIIPRKTA